MTQKPDIVLVVGNHHRADFLGCAGNVLVRTPNLDALAQSGIRFDRAVTIYPDAGPACTALLTGAYPEDSTAPAGNLTKSPLGAALAAAGYAVVHVAPDAGLAATVQLATETLAMPATGPRAVMIRLPSIWDFEDIDDAHFGPYRGNGVPLATYFANVSAYDAALGQIVATLKKTGRLENTVLVYTSLSGETFRYRDFVNHANSCHAESIRVPLIVAALGHIVAGQVSQAIVGLHDLAPTVAGLAGVGIPGTQGRDLAPLLAGKDAEAGWRDHIYLKNIYRRHIDVTFKDGLAPFAVFPDWPQRAVWDGRHKLILSADGGECRFYDLRIDPEEEFNLYALPCPSPQGLVDQFSSRRDQVEAMATHLKSTAETLGDALGVQLAERVLADDRYGTQPEGVLI